MTSRSAKKNAIKSFDCHFHSDSGLRRMTNAKINLNMFLCMEINVYSNKIYKRYQRLSKSIWFLLNILKFKISWQLKSFKKSPK